MSEDQDDAGEDRNFVTALARGLDVLACYRKGEVYLGNNDFAERCGLPRSTVSRLTYTLTKLGFLHFSDDAGKYRRGAALIALSSTVLAGLNVRQLARPGMMELAKMSNATVGLGVRDRLSMRYIECCHGSAAILLNVDTGSRLSLGRSAMGRAYLALCGDAERAEILDELRTLDEVAWPKLSAGIERSLQVYSDTGYATSFGDWQETVSAVAVGFNPGGGLPPMTLSCGAPSVITPPDFLLDEVGPRLKALAGTLEGCASL